MRYQIGYWAVVMAILLFAYGNYLFGADLPARQKGKVIFSRITGKPLAVKNPTGEKLLSLADEKKWEALATLATEDPAFIATTVRELAGSFTARNGKADRAFNDAQMLVMGVVRDHLDFRTILTGDFRYDVNLREPFFFGPERLVPQLTKQPLPNPDIHPLDRAAIFLTNAWAKNHYDAGTNRRAVQHAFANFLCASQDEWKDTGVNDRRVRQDVSRFPDKNSEGYQKKCRACHSVMDGLGGAFASFDWKDGALVYGGPLTVMPKMLQNAANHPEGFVTVSSDWVNLANRSHNKYFGWRSPQNGIGLKSFARLFAESKAFSRCLVKKSVEQICDEGAVARFSSEDVEALVSGWESQRYDLALLYARVAAQEKCIVIEAEKK